ncbi:MAG: NepR family anti-sigma factor [Hyphomicrobiales bacterium]
MNMHNPTGNRKRPGVPRPADNKVLHDALSKKLRAYYAEIEHQPLPRHLVDLLDKLDKPESR